MVLQATITQHVILRGSYQTLPIALYGWVHARGSTKEASRLPFENFVTLANASAKHDADISNSADQTTHPTHIRHALELIEQGCFMHERGSSWL